jgi:hypothetical protein
MIQALLAVALCTTTTSSGRLLVTALQYEHSTKQSSSSVIHVQVVGDVTTTYLSLQLDSSGLVTMMASSAKYLLLMIVRMSMMTVRAQCVPDTVQQLAIAR